MRRIGVALSGVVIGAAFYLLLIDTPNDVELYAMVPIVLLAGAAFLVSREQDFSEAAIRARWLRHAGRIVGSIPVHIGWLCLDAVAQLWQRRAERGIFRAVPFAAGAEEPRDAGRRALAEALGSVAPNTIVIGVDHDRRLLLVHQLRPRGGREQLDPLELG